MKKKALLILAGCLLLFGTSCYYDTKIEYDDGDNGGGVPPPEDEISFAESILPIIEDYNCAGCHKRIDPLGFALENYGPTGKWRELYENGREVGCDIITTIIAKKLLKKDKNAKILSDPKLWKFQFDNKRALLRRAFFLPFYSPC